MPDCNHVQGKLRQEDHLVQGQPELIATESRLMVKILLQKEKKHLITVISTCLYFTGGENGQKLRNDKEFSALYFLPS